MKFSDMAFLKGIFSTVLSSGLASRTRSQRGVALATSILALMLITLLGLTLTTAGIVASKTSTNDKQATQVFFLAESGIAHAKGLILNQGLDFDTYLQAGDGTGCTGDELSDTPVTPFSAGEEITSIASGGEIFGSGRYEVMVCDDDDGDSDLNDDDNDRILVVSTGFGADGRQRQDSGGFHRLRGRWCQRNAGIDPHQYSVSGHRRRWESANQR